MRWKAGTFEKIETNDSSIEKLIHTFKEQNVNGGAVISCFKVHNEQVFKEIPYERDRYEHFFRKIFSSLDIIQDLEELKIHTSEKYKSQFQYRSAVMLDGSIAFQIIRGGAYKYFPERMVIAKQLASDVCQYMFQDRYEDIKVFESDSPWTDWFYDVAWDVTWMVLDSREQKMWFICATDTD
ncbi:hypothetical protein P5757_15785 [Bacillus tropicus]|uniref:hypothetical protein n=1 Tax=Bacillus tropicus TaxID=2026188 RepID=UPI00115519ED|nr:hypothetical protein [Bacillus tropicus]MDF9554150.1 hypothetical protein [Bacillus tropicus]MDF9590238.1 hypothetical protein [Bacillus tropicus]MDF9645451.1 hypothetical protein [Bacillus tropicus]USK98210.1 hypothetical protein LIS81_06455 [Bacillus tropicus]